MRVTSKMKPNWIVVLALLSMTPMAQAIEGDTPLTPTALLEAARLPTAPLLMRGPNFELRYQFFGARTFSTQVLTSIHCTATGSSSVNVELQFFDFNTLQIGVGAMTLQADETKTATAHASTVVADTAIYDEDLLIPVGNDLNQGLIQVFTDSRAIICSAQVLDATTIGPTFIEALEVRALFTPEATTATDQFTGARASIGVVEAVVHCTSAAGATGEVSFYESNGFVIATSPSLTIPPNGSITVATRDVAFFREDAVVLLPSDLAQGQIKVTFVDSQCTAQLVPPNHVIPPFLITLGGTTTAPDRNVFADGFESGGTSAWTLTVP